MFRSYDHLHAEIYLLENYVMLLSHHQNAGQNRDIKIANKSFQNVLQYKNLGITVTNQNLVQEKIKRRPNSGDAC
jgi:hypothetical protein